MSKCKYKRARSNINRLLSEIMEFSDKDVSTTTVPAVSTAPEMQQRPNVPPPFDQYQQPLWGTQYFGAESIRSPNYRYQLMPVPPPQLIQQQQPLSQQQLNLTPAPSTSPQHLQRFYLNKLRYTMILSE